MAPTILLLKTIVFLLDYFTHRQGQEKAIFTTLDISTARNVLVQKYVRVHTVAKQQHI